MYVSKVIHAILCTFCPRKEVAHRGNPLKSSGVVADCACRFQAILSAINNIKKGLMQSRTAEPHIIKFKDRS